MSAADATRLAGEAYRTRLARDEAATRDDKISRAKFDEILARSNTSRERPLAEVRQLADVIVPPPLPQPVCRDPDDDHVLSCLCALPQSSCCHALFAATLREQQAQPALQHVRLGW